MTLHRAYLLDVGLQPYDPIHTLQRRLAAARRREALPDVLLFVEHEPVITLGRRADETHVLAPKDVLAQEGIIVRRIERGGDVTYHGPGQLVAYPIVHLASHRLGISEYMHLLEQAVLETLADYGLVAHRREGYIGVWLGQKKIASFGVRVARGVTYHGLALNVSPEMRHWGYIIPCGIADAQVTSMALELASPPPMEEVKARLAEHLAALLHLAVEPISLDDIQRSLPTLEEEG